MCAIDWLTLEAVAVHRFHFDLVNGHTTIRDADGVAAENLSHALEQAQAALEEMRASGDLPARHGGWQLMVRSASGTVLASIPLPSIPFPGAAGDALRRSQPAHVPHRGVIT